MYNITTNHKTESVEDDDHVVFPLNIKQVSLTTNENYDNRITRNDDNIYGIHKTLMKIKSMLLSKRNQHIKSLSKLMCLLHIIIYRVCRHI